MKKMSRVILLGTIMFTLGACKNNKTTTESVLAESITNESSISEVAESSSCVLQDFPTQYCKEKVHTFAPEIFL